MVCFNLFRNVSFFSIVSIPKLYSNLKCGIVPVRTVWWAVVNTRLGWSIHSFHLFVVVLFVFLFLFDWFIRFLSSSCGGGSGCDCVVVIFFMFFYSSNWRKFIFLSGFYNFLFFSNQTYAYMSKIKTNEKKLFKTKWRKKWKKKFTKMKMKKKNGFKI